jgi:hypothetical protein
VDAWIEAMTDAGRHHGGVGFEHHRVGVVVAMEPAQRQGQVRGTDIDAVQARSRGDLFQAFQALFGLHHHEFEDLLIGLL